MSEDLARLGGVLGSRYTVDREIGRGGTATVYLATDRKHNRRVAVKVLPPALAAALGPERFLREIEVAAGLTHPHILTLHDSGHGDGLLYYVMPYVDGESLRDRLRREGQLPLADCLRIGTQVADALSYAHTRGVVHRDVKPENVLLADGHALLADFGIAQALDSGGGQRLTDTGLVVGTAAYMSPEQAAGARAVDGRTDVYALGCVLYEMLTGEPPYLGATRQAVLAKRLAEPVPKVRTLRPAVAPAVERTVTKALARSPADRFATVAQFGRALSNSLTELEGTPMPASAARRRRRVLGVGVGVAVAAALTVAIVELLPTAPRLEPRRVLVTVFQNETGDPALNGLGAVATDYVSRGLAGTGLVEVLDVRNELSDEGRGAAIGLRARDRARDLGAGSLLRGTYYGNAGSLQFEAQVVDVETGEILRAVPPVVGDAAHPTEAVERLRQRLMAELAALFDPRFAPFEAATVPPSYEAYLEVLAANDLFWKGAAGCADECSKEALERMERAAALDSTFTLPRTAAAVMSMLQGDCGRAETIRAELAGKRLPPTEQAQLEVAVAACRKDYPTALASARRAMEHEPHGSGMTQAVPLLALLLNRPREALRVLATIEPRRFYSGAMPYYWHVTTAYHLLGEHERELKVARQARRESPAHGADLEAVALAALGRVEEVNERVAAALRGSRRDPRAGSPAGWMRMVGLELRAHGEPAAGLSVLERALAWRRQHPLEDGDDARRELARALYDAEHWEEAREAYEQLRAADSLDPSPRAALGALAARRGDRAEALRADAWLASFRGDPGTEAANVYARAVIAALLGDRARAVALLRKAFDDGFAFIPVDITEGPELDADLEGLRSYEPFEELMKPRG